MIKNLKNILSDDLEALAILEEKEKVALVNKVDLIENRVTGVDNKLDESISKLEKDIETIELHIPEKGDRGEKGDKGDVGEKGETGEQGIQGETGKDGINGIDGMDGKEGKNGSSDTGEEIIVKVNESESKISVERIEGIPDYSEQIKELRSSKVKIPWKEITDIPAQLQRGGGASRFTQLSDVPHSYTGAANQVVTVNPTETGLIFSTLAPGGVTNVTATAPVTSSGGATPNISTSMNTNKLIGRGSAGVGVMQEITLGTGLSMSGTTLNAAVATGFLALDQTTPQTVINGRPTFNGIIIAAGTSINYGVLPNLSVSGTAGDVARFGSTLFIYTGTFWRRVGAVFTGPAF